MRLIHFQRGQILPLTLSGVVVAATILFLMANLGNKVTEKSVVVNAADSAAYSGAVFVARHLNLMAYTNRAMIANHVGVGHFIAYVSWIRYVEQLTDRIDQIAQFFPIVAQISEVIKEFAKILRQVAEQAGKVYVPGVSKLNNFYHSAQKEVQSTIKAETINQLMRDTAKNFDPNINVNDSAALENLDPAIAASINTALSLQRELVSAFVAPLNVTDRDGELVTIVETAYGANETNDGVVGGMSSEWLNDRGWSEGFPSFELVKEFSTEHQLENNLADWKTTDELEQQFFSGKLGTETFASGEASVRDNQEGFDSDYVGIPGYYNLAKAEPNLYALPIFAFASKSQRQVATRDTLDILELEPQKVPLSGIAVAQAEFRRPASEDFPDLINPFFFGLFGDPRSADELSNLYNPFWQARLIGVDRLALEEVRETAELFRGN